LEQFAVNLLDVAYAISTLCLLSAGLALVFGLMRIINLAHGEFIVLGGYVTLVATHAGVPIWLAIFVMSPLMVGLFGLIVEWVIIRHLYGRMMDTMLATWGLSMLISGALVTVFGNTTTGVTNPIGAITIGEYQVGGYSVLIIGVTVVLMLLSYVVLRYTRAGLIVRAAMQSADVVSGLGYNPKTVYRFTFALGAALSGLAGGLMAPLIGLTPASGGQFIAKSFITVISGGASVVTGTLSASTLFGLVSKGVEWLSTPVWGELALLVVAIVLLRLMPQGITGRYFKGKV
jgi:branched-chain amino acid transport system permease protein